MTKERFVAQRLESGKASLSDRLSFSSRPQGEKEILKPRQLHIAVVGAIGAGKTKLANLISQEFELDVYREDFENNPYLKGFYKKDSEEFAFDSQVYFLSMGAVKRKKIRKLLVKDVPIVEDQGIEGDIIIEHVQRQMGWISEKDHQVYIKSCLNLTRDLPKPDIFVALSASKETTRERIIKRARPMELQMVKKHPEYFDKVTDAFSRWFKVVRREQKTVFINTNNHDFVGDFRDKYSMLNNIADWITYYAVSSNQFDINGRNEFGLIKPDFTKNNRK